MKGSVKKAINYNRCPDSTCYLCIIELETGENFNRNMKGCDLSADVEGAVREGTYTKYLNAHEDAACPAEDIEVDLFAYMEGEA